MESLRPWLIMKLNPDGHVTCHTGADDNLGVDGKA